MNGVKETYVTTAIGKTRIWTKGRGRKVCVLGGIGGIKKWTPFLDALSETRKVVVPSLPGFPGGARSEGLDQLMDWVLAACDVVEAADCLDCDLVGASIGATLAAEIAAFWPDNVKKLALIAPFGLYDEAHPVADIFAQRPGSAAIFAQKPDLANAYFAASDGADAGEWEVESLRANIATACIIWPLGDTRLKQRLWRITAPTLVLWGAEDQVMPPSYAKLVQSGIGKNAKTKIIRKAGHMAELDQPGALVRAITGFM